MSGRPVFPLMAGMVHRSDAAVGGEWCSEDLAALAELHAVSRRGEACGVVVQAASGAIVAATPMAEEILGLTFEQMIGRTSMDPRWATVDEQLRLLPGTEHPSMRALASQKPIRDAVMGVHRPCADPAGKHIWLRVSSVPIRRSAGEPLVVLTAFSIMTGLRAVELQLMESEANFRFIAENSSDTVAWQRFDTTFLWVSPASLSMLGRSPEELVGTRSLDLVHPDDLYRSRAVERDIVAGATHSSAVRRMRHADGHYVWVETTVRVTSGQAASAAQMQTSSRNVDDRIAAQLAQAEAEASRDSAVRLFRTAMEHAAIGMAIRGLDGRLVEINGALCTMLGRRADELRGSLLRDYTHPGDIAAAGAARTVLLSGRAVAHDSERRYLRSDGAVLWVQATSVLLPRDGAEPQLVLTQMQDVTARKEAIDQLTQLAVTDSLTGLSNRAVLMDRLAHALARAARGRGDAGVVFVDLDGFKAVNDDLGHDVGDQLLRQVAARLSAAMRAGDTAARIGGDEFVVLCERIDDIAQVREVADRIASSIGDCFAIGEHRVCISASVGVTIGNGSSAREVLGQADKAMYRAKRQGRGIVEVHD